jgi:hypothetical protein
MGARRLVLVFGITLVFCFASALPAHAAVRHDVDDACSQIENTFFSRYGPEQYWHWITGNGYNNVCFIWTTTTNGTSSINYAEWYLPSFPENCSSYTGDYYVDTWIDSDSHFGTRSALYRRWRNGHGGGITETYKVAQAAIADRFFRVTGVNSPPTYDHFYACNGGFMSLGDLTKETSLHYIGWDWMKFLPR